VPKQVATGTLGRLEGRRDRIRELREQLQLEMRARDELIVDAIDEGLAQRAVARSAGVSDSRVPAILAESEPDAVIPRG